MNENTKSNRFSQHINVEACTVKSDPPKFEYRKIYGFAGKKTTTKPILPSEDAFNIEKWVKNFNKKMDKFFENLCEKTYDAMQQISRSVRNMVRAYLRFLMLCAFIAIGYASLVYLSENNPSIITNVPNITKLLQSMSVLAGYATDFLHWNFVWATRIIEHLIEEVNALIS